MKIALIEACREADAGSIGAWYVTEHAKKAGYPVDIIRRNKSGYDIELVSVHHCDDFERLAVMPKYAKWRLVGGHVMQNNPRPAIPFADAICVGEGETWIKKALKLLDETDDIASLQELPGTIVSKNWQAGMEIPEANAENPLPDNMPYLNRPGTRSVAWYVEIARGCPYRCKFCELGNSMPFRTYSMEQVKKCLDFADTKITRKINFYAPDEASHPHYHELFDYLFSKGYSASFSSMRIESVLKRGLPKIKKNHLVRVGIDGLTEETRRRVGKPITNDQIIEYFKLMLEAGQVQFKMFFIFGYPWEKVSDFKEFEQLMKRLKFLHLTKNVSLRIKWTPFIPQPCTPLADVGSQYDFEMVDKINIWHALHARPHSEPGWFIENDGMMGK
ncbi:MAG: B12-binding domain-containing radical SAM protein, partial [Candidatus Omnitrophica bacterium]|nr:B12-binding domain-containing radical SAM protein [Candidatus Omnitrophota bacterium]